MEGCPPFNGIMNYEHVRKIAPIKVTTAADREPILGSSVLVGDANDSSVDKK